MVLGYSVLWDRKMSNSPYFWFPSPRITLLEWITFLKFMVWHIIWAIAASLDRRTKIVQVGLRRSGAEVRGKREHRSSPQILGGDGDIAYRTEQLKHHQQIQARVITQTKARLWHTHTHTGGGFLPASVLGGFVNLQERGRVWGGGVWGGGADWHQTAQKQSQQGPEKKQEEIV